MAPPQITPLSDGWSLRSAQPLTELADQRLPATVPGCVHTDLLAAGVIPDPFLDSNEQTLTWIADADWIYATRFATTAAMRDHDRVDLVFDGLDTLATIELNGRVIGQTANMHRRYRFDISSVLDDQSNDLAITFASATRHADDLMSQQAPWPSAYPGRPYNYVRKMACSWGWDWGPWLTTAGVWRAASVQSWRGARLASVRPTATVDGDDRGSISVAVDLERASSVAFLVRATLIDPNGERVVTSSEIAVDASTKSVAVSLEAGIVARWWPHTHGEQPLYRLDVDLLDGDGSALDTWSRSIGFRSIALDTSPDDVGSAFTFIVNGRPIFGRGVNWIPDDPFPSRITPDRLHDRLIAAVAANVDLVRVWGGGLYEDDDFYNSCDRLGLMVWQDFAFACAAYPEELLAEEVGAEAVDNVDRLMSHPSLVLWNGNNENIWGWFDWRWQRRLDGRSWGAGFYFDLLPRVVAALDSTRPYWPGSPYSGSMTVSANADAHGCTHVWDVWNLLDYERYRDHTPRFVAEFGWQAPPTWRTLQASISDDPLTPTSPGMQNHQKAQDGDAKLARGLRAHVGIPDSFEPWWWATQLLQARAVTTGIEHFRSLRGTCMGTIWWQLNDCWPVTSWAVVDSSGQPKPAWYALQSAYASRLLTIQPRGSELVAFAVNEHPEAWTVDGSVTRIAFDGTVLASQRIELVVEGGSSVSIVLDDDVATSGAPSGELLIVEGGGARAVWWFAPDKDLALEPPQLHGSVSSIDDSTFTLTVHAVNLVRDLAVMPDRLVAGARADRQLITLLPGDSTSITITRWQGALPTIDALLSRPVCWSAHSAIARAKITE